MKRSEENLKAIIDFLQQLIAWGMLEQGQAEALKKGISDLRRVRRSHDPAKIWAATDRVARIFLRIQGR